ncbi:MAG: TIR domain-containing protein [Hyphomicrobiales bacterium]|nr:TIR domain-containing protein [Hyphomicrobiales bacterium]
MATGTGGQHLKVFISYSRRDASAFADELLTGLRLTGFAPKLDLHDIAKGEAWEERLGKLIAEADTVVFVVTPQGIASERCQWEIDKALELQKRLLPVVWIDVPEAEIPPKLKALNYTHFSNGRSFAKGLEELSTALRQDLPWIREHTRLGEEAARWNARGRANDLLLRGAAIAAAQEWQRTRKSDAPEVTALQQAFINASAEAESERNRHERQQLEAIASAQTARALSQRRAGRLLWAVGALVLLIAGNTFWQSYDLARRETLVYTSLAAKAYGEQEFDRGMRFALQAYPPQGGVPWAPFSTALEGKLAGGPIMSRLRLRLNGHTGAVVGASFSSDGRRVVTASSDGTARVWDAESGQEIALLKAHTSWVRAASFSPDGKRIVTASDDQTARVWDAESGQEIALLKAHEGGALSAGFSPDGRRLVTAGRDRVARVWDMQWALEHGTRLRERVCAEKLIGAQEFTDDELADPILSDIDRDDPYARNPCLRRGPLSVEYWTRLPSQWARGLGRLLPRPAAPH